MYFGKIVFFFRITIIVALAASATFNLGSKLYINIKYGMIGYGVAAIDFKIGFM